MCPFIQCLLADRLPECRFPPRRSLSGSDMLRRPLCFALGNGFLQCLGFGASSWSLGT